MLTDHYRDMLRDAVATPSTDYRKTNAELMTVIAMIKMKCPDKFHTADSLKYRMFWDKPATLADNQYDYYFNRAPR